MSVNFKISLMNFTLTIRIQQGKNPNHIIKNNELFTIIQWFIIKIFKKYKQNYKIKYFKSINIIN